MREAVTIDQAIELLNEMLEIDPIATNSLFAAGAPCNEKLRDHPTIQVFPPFQTHPCLLYTSPSPRDS